MNNTNTSNAAKTNETNTLSRRDLIAMELDRAVDAAHHVSRLKQSEWYQARKAELMAIDARQ